MEMNDSHRALLVRWHSTFGLPSINDDDARQWTRRLAEQFSFEFPGEGWCHKAASTTRPPSTDVIARDTVVLHGDRRVRVFVGYDIIKDQGSDGTNFPGRPPQSFEFNPRPLDLTGQHPIPVDPTNHLGTSPPQPPYEPPNSGIEARLAAVEAKVQSIERWIEGYDV